MKSQNNLTEKMKKSFSENFPSHNEESKTSEKLESEGEKKRLINLSKSVYSIIKEHEIISGTSVFFF